MIVFFAFLVAKVPNIPPKCGPFIRTAKICLISFPVIFSVPRRGTIKSCKKILRNYESGGHNLDTIMAQFFPLQKAILATFIVSNLHTFGRENKKLSSIIL